MVALKEGESWCEQQAGVMCFSNRYLEELQLLMTMMSMMMVVVEEVEAEQGCCSPAGHLMMVLMSRLVRRKPCLMRV